MGVREGDSTWSLGVLVAVPLVFLLALAFVVGGVLLRRWWKNNPSDFDADPAKWLSRGAFVMAVGLLVGIAAGTYPWKAEYHQYVTKVGTVESIRSRLLGSSDSFQQKFVARFTDGRELGCEDTRCALVRPGDRLAMACKRQWQYAGVDGYDCKFLASRREA